MCLDKNPEYAYSATGYILPCCYSDNENIDDFKSLMQEHLSVENIKDVNKDIINSIEWKDFFKLLIETPENAPRACKYYCKNIWITKKVIVLD
tara:strand:+ start:265 stop:543 length:279 start_codon:yes stop_codon:yes gene_type:complete